MNEMPSRGIYRVIKVEKMSFSIHKDRAFEIR